MGDVAVAISAAVVRRDGGGNIHLISGVIYVVGGVRQLQGRRSRARHALTRSAQYSNGMNGVVE
jgi:hypothetical protein